MRTRFCIALLLLFIALFFEIGIQTLTGVSLMLAWAVLLTAAFFLSLPELLALIIISAGMLNWTPMISVTLGFFIIAPLAAYALKEFLQLKPLFGSLISIIIAIAILYVAWAPSFLWTRPGILALDLAASLACGAVSFWTFEWVSNEF